VTLCALVLGGCVGVNAPNTTEPSTVPVTEPVGTSADDVIDIGYDPLPCSEETLYEQLFDLNNKVTVRLDMPDSELQKLQDDYDYYSDFGSKSPIYRMANLVITIRTATETTTYQIEEVGVRMKGNTSRRDFYNARDGIYNYIHLKLDFQETFDDEDYYGAGFKVWNDDEQRDARKDRTFATLESLELRWNKCYDQTYLRETYAYALYRSEGVMAPLTNLCSFDWSGSHMGVFCMVEPVDKLFLSKRLPEAEQGGDLYKCGWPASFTAADSIGIEDEDKGEFYVYDLKTNKKTSDHSTLINWINELNCGTMTRKKLEELVDMEYFLSYAAVAYFLGNPDDLRNNYNNFYLYFKADSGKAVIIPYDYDRCLGLTYEWDPTGNGVTRDNPFSEEMAAQDNNRGFHQRNPLFLYSVVRGGFYVRDFADVLRRVEQNPMLSTDSFERWFIRSSALYAGDELPSKTPHNANGRQFRFALEDGASGNLSFKTYITEKMAFYQSCMSDREEYLAHAPAEQTVYYIRGTFTDWADHPAYGMKMENGVATISLTFTENAEFKVYDHVLDRWYGPENMSEETTAPYTAMGPHANIYLQSGTYRIVYDPQTRQITITEE
jgi:spore coat protein CotH